jgi:hypothetical protein
MQCLNDTLCYAISGWQIFKTTNAGGPMIGLGENEKERSSKFEIYPNPALDRLFINGNCGNSSILIINAQGQELKTYSSIDNFGIDISYLARGFYLYVITDRQGGAITTGKFIKE